MGLDSPRCWRSVGVLDILKVGFPVLEFDETSPATLPNVHCYGQEQLL